ncbi:hypothetical protein G4228_008347 [Cervus hanglu yarkandensis]|nr:hypothetical protein G4228_008347 [Cervus hanglu yarkandensis]
MVVSWPARPAGPRPSPPAAPRRRSRSLRAGPGPVASLRPNPEPHRRVAGRPRPPPAPARPLRDPRHRLLKSRAQKTARRLLQEPTRQPRQPSWHIRLRGPQAPRRRRVRQRRQPAPRPSQGPSGRPAPAPFSLAPFSWPRP